MIAPVVAAVTLHLTPPDYTRLSDTAPYSAEAPTRRTRAQRERKRLRARVVRWAASRIGMPYVYGASGPRAFDCSGLVVWAYSHIGRALPRTTWVQRSVGVAVSGGYRRGDLVFAYGDSHVAIYAGHGFVIVAPRAGDVVKREPISWLRPFSHVRRLIHG